MDGSYEQMLARIDNGDGNFESVWYRSLGHSYTLYILLYYMLDILSFYLHVLYV